MPRGFLPLLRCCCLWLVLLPGSCLTAGPPANDLLILTTSLKHLIFGATFLEQFPR